MPPTTRGRTSWRATKSIEIRNVAKDVDPTSLDSGIEIASFTPTWARSAGRPVLLMSIAVHARDANEATPYEGETTILAAFDVESGPRLVDALVVHNTHFNAGESYDEYTALLLRNGRFAVISSVFLLSTQGCGATFTETPAYSTAPRPPAAYPDLVLRVTLKSGTRAGACTTPICAGSPPSIASIASG